MACALNSNCNIIPVFDNFSMPKSTDLPIAMRPLTSYNGVNWVHEYQTACMDKIARFIKTQSMVENSRKHSESERIEFILKEKNLTRHSISTEKIERTDPKGMVIEANINEVWKWYFVSIIILRKKNSDQEKLLKSESENLQKF